MKNFFEHIIYEIRSIHYGVRKRNLLRFILLMNLYVIYYRVFHFCLFYRFKFKFKKNDVIILFHFWTFRPTVKYIAGLFVRWNLDHAFSAQTWYSWIFYHSQITCGLFAFNDFIIKSYKIGYRIAYFTIRIPIDLFSWSKNS